MSNERKRQRHAEVVSLREWGRRAFRDGIARDRNPHNYCDALQWWQGYDDAARKAQELRADQIKTEQEYAMDERIRRIVRDELLKNGLIRHTSHPDDPSWM